jgi:hypothetical protein
VSHGITRTETRSATFRATQRSGPTIQNLRDFLVDADAVGLPDGTEVRIQVNSWQGGNVHVAIDAEQRIDLGIDLGPVEEHESPEPGPLDSGPPFDPEAEPEVVEPPRPEGADS